VSGYIDIIVVMVQPLFIEQWQKSAAELTDRCFAFIVPKVRPGVSESEIAREIEAFFRKNGAECSFPSIVAFGPHSCIPHYADANDASTMLRVNKKQETRLKKNDIALLDFGAKVYGYCADMTRIVFVGKPKKEWIRAYETVLTVQRAILDTLDSRVGKKKSFSGAELDRTAKDMIAGAGFPPYKHSLGHAIGKQVHEPPKLSVKKDARIYPGMIFTVEPGIYIENEYGIRVEDTVLLTENGVEILTKSTKEMIVV
jgi:Xaa-Pro aminopeptidase